MDNMFLLLVSFGPYDPAINTHDRIIKIYGGFTEQLPLYTYPYINNGIDQADRVYKNIFDPAEPNASDTGEYGNIFRPGSVFQTLCKLLPDLR